MLVGDIEWHKMMKNKVIDEQQRGTNWFILRLFVSFLITFAFFMAGEWWVSNAEYYENLIYAIHRKANWNDAVNLLVLPFMLSQLFWWIITSER